MKLKAIKNSKWNLKGVIVEYKEGNDYDIEDSAIANDMLTHGYAVAIDSVKIESKKPEIESKKVVESYEKKVVEPENKKRGRPSKKAR